MSACAAGTQINISDAALEFWCYLGVAQELIAARAQKLANLARLMVVVNLENRLATARLVGSTHSATATLNPQHRLVLIGGDPVPAQ